MWRYAIALGLLAASLARPSLGADAFDRYMNPVLAKVPTAAGVKEVKHLTAEEITDNDRILPGMTGAFLVVKTNGGRFSKLLVQAARQRVDNSAPVPILLIERFVTYREAQEQMVVASGQRVDLFSGFRLNLDIGQIVPQELAADLRFVADGAKVYVEPVNKASLYLLTKPLAEAAPKKTAKVVVGETFEPRYFAGSYKLYDDGRRTGNLTLRVAADGEVTGGYYSEKDGRKYAVNGKIGNPRHTIQFTVTYPRSEQTFQGWLFTGNGKAMTGYSRVQDRETGFYAVRVEDE
ncbi:MAG TPA: hypothetical protein VK395_11515 [Gemmataceae bacterium]|nr:hypothetical protein [Gemmataceae bacterium]